MMHILKHALRVLKNSITSYAGHNCLALSASISFYAMFSFFPLLLLTVSIFANPQIMKQHAGKKKDGKAINCMYCHGNNANPGIAKQGGQNKAQLMQKPGCKGQGCH